MLVNGFRPVFVQTARKSLDPTVWLTHRPRDHSSVRTAATALGKICGWLPILERRSRSKIKILETKRLVLRRLESSDLDSLCALYSDPEVRRYFPEGTLTREETRAELEWFLDGHPEDPDLGLWATIYKETDLFIGRCGLLPWTIDGRPEVEVAYLLAKRYWGQGLGTEAAQAILDYGFEQLDLSRLICLIESDNLASIKVAEKIGMTFESEGSDDQGPFLLYSRSKPFAGGVA